MNRIKSRLNKLGRRLVKHSGDVQYLTDHLTERFSGADSDGSNPWLNPVQLPPEDQIYNNPPPKEETVSELLMGDQSTPEDDSSERRRTPFLVGTHFLEDWLEWQILSGRLANLAGAARLDELLYEASLERVRGASDQVEELMSAYQYLRAFSQTYAPDENAPISQSSNGNRLVSHLRKAASEDRGNDSSTPDPADLMSSVFRVGERDLLVRGLLRRNPHNDVPSPLLTLRSRLVEIADEILRYVPPIVKNNETAARRLRAYRCSTLSLSWLLNSNENDESEGSLIDRLCQKADNATQRSGMESASYLKTILQEGREENPQNMNPSEGVLRRAARASQEIGVGRFAEMVEGIGPRVGGKQAGQSALTAPNMSAQVISSSQKGLSQKRTEDTDVCIAFSLGEKYYPGVSKREESKRERPATERRLDDEIKQRHSELEQVLDGVKQWLADYGPTNKTVLIITDLWAPRQFGDSHAPLLEAWSNRGASIFVATPNYRGNGLSLVDRTL